MLGRAECLGSTACTLVLLGAEEPEPYACRPTQGDCEAGLAQSSADLAARCGDRPGCQARPATCYCGCEPTAPCDCECAGGHPPACAPL